MVRSLFLLAVFTFTPTHAAEPLRVDLAGDPLPAGAVARFGTVRLRHDRSVMDIAFAPDSKTLATSVSFSNESLRLWDTATGRERKRLEYIGAYGTALALSPDGRLLAMGSDRDEVLL